MTSCAGIEESTLLAIDVAEAGPVFPGVMVVGAAIIAETHAVALLLKADNGEVKRALTAEPRAG